MCFLPPYSGYLTRLATIKQDKPSLSTQVTSRLWQGAGKDRLGNGVVALDICKRVYFTGVSQTIKSLREEKNMAPEGFWVLI